MQRIGFLVLPGFQMISIGALSGFHLARRVQNLRRHRPAQAGQLGRQVNEAWRRWAPNRAEGQGCGTESAGRRYTRKSLFLVILDTLTIVGGCNGCVDWEGEWVTPATYHLSRGRVLQIDRFGGTSRQHDEQ